MEEEEGEMSDAALGKREVPQVRSFALPKGKCYRRTRRGVDRSTRLGRKAVYSSTV